MNKTILFALAAILATIPSSSLAQTYSYNFDSKHWTGSNDPTPPVIQLKEDWDCGLPPCSATVSGSVLPTSSGYSVTSVTVSNTNGKAVLIFSMTGPHGTFKAFGVTAPITGIGTYAVDFSFADPPYATENQLYEEFSNATLTISNYSAPVYMWCTGCVLQLRLRPGIPIERDLEATVEFQTLDGAPIGPSQRITVGPGQVGSVTFQPAQLARTGAHLDVIPVVTIDGGGSPAPLVQVTGEVRDASGVGLLLVSDNFSTPPASLAPQSIASGQIMRLIARATSPNPCDATLGFRNAGGARVGPEVFINLRSGEAKTLDLDASALALGRGQGALVQPVAQIVSTPTAAGAAISSVCSVTSEVFDAQTGRPGTYQNALLR